MDTPKVSFVVPCYQLAGYLNECVQSILSQTFTDFELLIMDDCSPDHTEEIARSLTDPRVRYIRNESNIGVLKNYNKGINLSKGEYIWLISADDYLRSRHILQRYVEILDKNPNIGYAFCPGVSVIDGQEIGVIEGSIYKTHDEIVKGHTFLKTIGKSCSIIAASGMVRRRCYEKVGLFPLDISFEDTKVDLTWAGDWYLWAAFTLFYDVVYFAEPMVCYRQHTLSCTQLINQQRIENCILADIAVPWLIKQKAEMARIPGVRKICLDAISMEYSRHIFGKQYRSGIWSITLERFEQSVSRNTPIEAERLWIKSRTYASVGDRYYHRGDIASAKRLYRAGLQQDAMMPKVYLKLMLIAFGKPGNVLRNSLKNTLYKLQTWGRSLGYPLRNSCR